MVGILVSFWDGPFSGAMLVLGSVTGRYNPAFYSKWPGSTGLRWGEEISQFCAYAWQILSGVGAHNSMVVEMVPLKGDIGGIVHPPIGRKNTTYIPLIVLAEPGGLYATDPTFYGNQKQQPLNNSTSRGPPQKKKFSPINFWPFIGRSPITWLRGP